MSAAAKGRLFHAESRLAQHVAPENRSSELDSYQPGENLSKEMHR